MRADAGLAAAGGWWEATAAFRNSGIFSAHLPKGAVTSWPEKKRTGRIDQQLRVEESHSEYQTQRGRTGELALLLSPASVKDSSGLFCLQSVRAPRCLITVSPARPWTNAFSWSFFSAGHFDCLSCKLLNQINCWPRERSGVSKC